MWGRMGALRAILGAKFTVLLCRWGHLGERRLELSIERVGHWMGMGLGDGLDAGGCIVEW